VLLGASRGPPVRQRPEQHVQRDEREQHDHAGERSFAATGSAAAKAAASETSAASSSTSAATAPAESSDSAAAKRESARRQKQDRQRAERPGKEEHRHRAWPTWSVKRMHAPNVRMLQLVGQAAAVPPHLEQIGELLSSDTLGSNVYKGLARRRGRRDGRRSTITTVRANLSGRPCLRGVHNAGSSMANVSSPRRYTGRHEMATGFT
jgi:hypothetical protein